MVEMGSSSLIALRRLDWDTVGSGLTLGSLFCYERQSDEPDPLWPLLGWTLTGMLDLILIIKPTNEQTH